MDEPGAFPPIPDLVRGLRNHLGVFRGLLERPPVEEISFRPAPDRRSLLEIVHHLLDEEVEDFRRRLRLTLDRPGEPWPFLDPEGRVIERG